ncbi:MAG TPA: hypothetical protein VHN79_00645, partial [Lacunisphaera sp.]|nr:hypothetical protein [Lacunisphaera sp.]
MSKEHLWTALGRARIDLDFGGKLLLDPFRALNEAGLELTTEELETLRHCLAPVAGMKPHLSPEDIQFERKK